LITVCHLGLGWIDNYESENSPSYILPLVGDILIFAIFIFLILRISVKNQKCIRRVLRKENSEKYISRGLCWSLDLDGEYLHLDLNYTRTVNQYLVTELALQMKHDFDQEQDDSLIDQEYVNIEEDKQTYSTLTLRKTISVIVLAGGVFVIWETFYYNLTQ
jgi:hypothetical protein